MMILMLVVCARYLLYALYMRVIRNPWGLWSTHQAHAITAYDFLTSKRKMPSKEVFRHISQNKHTFNGAIIFQYNVTETAIKIGNSDQNDCTKHRDIDLIFQTKLKRKLNHKIKDRISIGEKKTHHDCTIECLRRWYVIVNVVVFSLLFCLLHFLTVQN